MRLEVHAPVVRFNSNQYIQDVRQEIRRAFFLAARQFLLAVVGHSNFRIFTGFTRGAFRNLEDVVGAVRGENGGLRIRYGSRGSTGGIRNAPAGNRTYYYYPPGGGRVRRTPQTGRGFSSQGERSIFSIAQGRTNFYFRFNVDIEYFTKSAWGIESWKAGEDAFVDAFLRGVHLPDPAEYIEGL